MESYGTSTAVVLPAVDVQGIFVEVVAKERESVEFANAKLGCIGMYKIAIVAMLRYHGQFVDDSQSEYDVVKRTILCFYRGCPQHLLFLQAHQLQSQGH